MSNLISRLLKFYGPSLKGVELEILGLKLPRSAKHILRDDGFVNSVDAYLKRLKRRYNDSAEYEADVSIDGMHYNASGKMITKGNIGDWKVTIETPVIVHHIFYEMPEYKDETMNEMTIISGRAHEETHVAHTWGGGALSKLEKLIRKEQDKRINLRSIGDREIVAQVGAIYALMKNGYSLDDIERYSEDFAMSGFKEALALYQDCQK